MLMEGYPLPVLRREPDTREFIFTKDIFEEVHLLLLEEKVYRNILTFNIQ